MFSRSMRMLGVAVLGLAAVTLTAVPAHADNPVVFTQTVTRSGPLCTLQAWVPLLGNVGSLAQSCD